MPVDTPPDSDTNAVQEAQLLRQNTRSPHPYLRHGLEIHQNSHNGAHVADPGGGDVVSQQGRHSTLENDDEPRRGTKREHSVTGSESGTEADDERTGFVKALPAPDVRPRKGLKVGERSEEAFLTPGQLDEEGTGYFGKDAGTVQEVGKREEEERERVLFRRRVHEFARRSSEVVLVGVLVLCVLCGDGVAEVAWRWRWELGCHVAVAAALVVAYPLKLSVVDTCATYSRPWQRFRVPASFDPATVLYPPMLPVLVALVLAPLNEQILLPNLILGLASLPQRLFPRSSRLAGVNVIHWFVSILPLILCENGFYLPEPFVGGSYPVKVRGGLPRQVLVTLYPLHHALLLPLHHLTTTSLLVTELHLLSAALINVFLFASTPQTYIIKACLWVGGVSLFVSTERVLHWNVTLARVPKWRFRRSGHPAHERRSLAEAVSSLIKVERAASAFSRRKPSDADEDKPASTLKQAPNGRPRLNTLFGSALETRHKPEPQSAVEPRKHDAPNGSAPNPLPSKQRQRRNTLPMNLGSATPPRPLSTRRKSRPGTLLWCLQMTPAQAQRRKWLYAAYIYLATAIIVLGPVRVYVSRHALAGAEPIGWALSYLFGDIPIFRDLVTDFGLQSWIPLLANRQVLMRTISTHSPVIPYYRDLVLGPANTRLLLIGYWGTVLLSGLLAVFSLTAYVEVDTRRKVFHGTMVAMLLPSTFVDPCACALALALILAVFLLLEVIRAGQVPPLGNAIGRFVAPYVDGRDLRGPVVVSHIFLLIGCAVPLWFSLAGTLRAADGEGGGWELADEKRDVGMVAGVICVGLGDAAASLIGRRYGRRKWVWVGGKSLEGSAAFAAAVVVGLAFGKFWLALGGWRDNGQVITGIWDLLVWTSKVVICACGASFLEAVLTGANDNVVVPVALWLFVKGLRL